MRYKRNKVITVIAIILIILAIITSILILNKKHVNLQYEEAELQKVNSGIYELDYGRIYPNHSLEGWINSDIEFIWECYSNWFIQFEKMLSSLRDSGMEIYNFRRPILTFDENNSSQNFEDYVVKVDEIEGNIVILKNGEYSISLKAIPGEIVYRVPGEEEIRGVSPSMPDPKIYIKVDNIDQDRPSITNPLTINKVSTKSISMQIQAKDELSGFSKIEWYYKKSKDSEYTLYATDTDIELNSEETGSTNVVTKTNTINNMENGTYNVKAKIYDVAGNSIESSVETVTIEDIPTLEKDKNVTFTITPLTWTQGPVLVKAETNVSEYTLQVSTDNKNWQNSNTVNFTENGTIYARLTDGVEAGESATCNVTNIDKIAPIVAFSQDGGEYKIVTGENTTIKTIITAEDEGGSNINTLQYAWSQSNTEQPNIWQDMTNKQEITKTGINNTSNWYLWVKAVDNAGNTSIVVSKVFKIVKNESEISSNTITYNYLENGGTSVTKQTDTKKKGEKIDLTVTSQKKGYEFVGWNIDKNATTAINQLTMGEEDIILYAIFKKDIKLQFIDYAGTKQTTTTKTLTIYNKNIGTTTAPQINEYTGWISQYWTIGEDPDSAKTVSSGEQITNITENATYYARYSKNYKIKFDLNGGQGTEINEIKNTADVNSKNINIIKTANVTIPEITAVREGHKALGWNTKADGTGVDYKTGENLETINDITLYIRWKKQDETQEEPETSFPEITIEKPDGWTNKNIPVKITPNGTTKIIKVTVNGLEIQPDSNNQYKYEITKNGTYIIEVEDENNNTIRKEITISTIDKTIPEIIDIKNSTISESQKGVTVELKLKDEESGVAKVEYSYDKNTWTDCLDENEEKDFIVTSYSYQAGESTISMKWTEETNKTIYFRVIDNIGNVSKIKSTTIELNTQEDNQPDDDNSNINNGEGDNNINNDGDNADNNQNNNEVVDDTISPDALPFAGNIKTIVLIVGVSILSIISIILIKKYKTLKEIIK